MRSCMTGAPQQVHKRMQFRASMKLQLDHVFSFEATATVPPKSPQMGVAICVGQQGNHQPSIITNQLSKALISSQGGFGVSGHIHGK